VANNPISNFDVDGRWFNDDGSIGQGPATFDLHGSSYRPMMTFSTNDGMHTNEGAGVQYTPFGDTQAYTDLMYAFHNGGTGGISNIGGTLRWWTDYEDPDPTVTGIGAFGILKFLDKGLTETFNTLDGIAYDLKHYQTESFFKDMEKHLNGGLGIASAAIAGQSKLPGGLKYLDKIKGLSKFSKVLGRAGVVGTALTVGVTFSEYYNDEWTAHTIVNTALLAGTLAATVFGAPAILTGIAIYGIADYTFGIGDKLDSEFGRGSIFWNTHIVN
ncbi:hypothetical protein, partial [Chryseobacterium sp.]|uniref:hypothetical protein n=1 Tax=Chryseobacterium sp. TaxID=1871047 RepID=UPI00283D38BB